MKAMKLMFAMTAALLMGVVVVGCSDSDEPGPAPVPVDKTALQAKIQEANQLLNVSTQGDEPGQYPAAAMTAFSEAITAAKAVNTNVAAKQDKVDEAVTALNTAITTFKAAQNPAVQLDKSALNAALTEAHATHNGAIVGFLKDQYRQSDKDTFKTAIDAAQVVCDNAAATQAEVDEAVTVLEAAAEAFTATANKQDYDQYLSVWLKMDGNTDDASYYANAIESVVCDGTAPALTQDRFGIADKAYAFDGGCLTVPNTELLRPASLTMAFWIKTASDASSDRAVASIHWWDGVIVKQIGKQIFLQGVNGGGAYVGTYTEFTPGSWYHVAVTVSDSKFEIYVNGVLDNTAEFTPAALVIPDTEPLCLGVMCSTHDYYSYQGALDEFRFYSKVLSADEIASIYNTEKP